MKNTKRQKFLSALALFIIQINLFAQSDIPIINGSLEGETSVGGQFSFSLEAWLSPLKFEKESAPDIHPSNIWGVNKKPSDGKSYVGMVVRDNGTYESITQALKSPMLYGMVYKFSIDLCKSDTYLSKSRTKSIYPGIKTQSSSTAAKANYIEAVVLLIEGKDEIYHQEHVLNSTPPITHNDWKKYNIEVKPKLNLDYLQLSAYFADSSVYNGNILIDNLSDLKAYHLLKDSTLSLTTLFFGKYFSVEAALLKGYIVQSEKEANDISHLVLTKGKNKLYYKKAGSSPTILYKAVISEPEGT